jgi:hypothetical protein
MIAPAIQTATMSDLGTTYISYALFFKVQYCEKGILCNTRKLVNRRLLYVQAPTDTKISSRIFFNEFPRPRKKYASHQAVSKQATFSWRVSV